MPYAFRRILLIILFAVVAGYAAYQLRGVWGGPKLALTSPLPGQTVSDQVLLVQGQALRADKIFLNDRKILPEQDGNFSEKLILAQGYNVIEVSAQDRFGRLTELRLPVVLSNHEQE